MNKNTQGELFHFDKHPEEISALRELTAKHRATPETGIANSFLVPKEHLQQLLDQDGAEGIRIHMGFDGQTLTPILTGADQSGNTIQTFAFANAPDCPPICAPQNEF